MTLEELIINALNEAYKKQNKEVTQCQSHPVRTAHTER